jgi:hypothetical protein
MAQLLDAGGGDGHVAFETRSLDSGEVKVAVHHQSANPFTSSRISRSRPQNCD